MLAGTWHARSLVGLCAASQAPDNAPQKGAIIRESDCEVWGLVVSWTVSAERASHRPAAAC